MREVRGTTRFEFCACRTIALPLLSMARSAVSMVKLHAALDRGPVPGNGIFPGGLFGGRFPVRVAFARSSSAKDNEGAVRIVMRETAAASSVILFIVQPFLKSTRRVKPDRDATESRLFDIKATISICRLSANPTGTRRLPAPR